MVITRTVAGKTITFEPADVEALTAAVLPEPIRDHYVVVGGRRFPPKQVLALLTGIDKADFTTHQARRILQRAGFSVGRLSTATPPSSPQPSWPHGGREAEALRPYRGQWVAQRGLRVLVAADQPLDVVGWLHEHGQEADHLFRVPDGPAGLDVAGPV